MQRNEEYVERKFEEYYRDNVQRTKPPPEMEKREYGFLLFKEGVMVRHRAFRTPSDLHAFIRTTVPAHAYNSTAYYLEPEEDMDRKNWQGADLTFDVDADHIATPCKYVHDVWTCKKCNAKGKGPVPDRCPECQGEKLDEEVWLCESCLERAKEEVIKLVDFLAEDFGFSRRDITTCFSGHRGYHVHVRAEEVKSLDSDERKEIVDYVTGLGFDLNLHEGLLDRKSSPEGSYVEDRGWRGRVARGLYEILTKTSEDEMASWRIKRRVAKTIAEKRDEFASLWIAEKVEEFPEGVGPTTWRLLIQKAVERESVKVDTVVTTDTHRLIRIPETLNGKTGFRAAEVSSIERFDPFSDAVAFKGEETVYVKEAPQFRVGNECLGPYSDTVVTIPAAAALLLISKGKASPRRD